MKEKIILVGGGGHCRSCLDVIAAEGRYNVIGILDLSENVGTDVLGVPVIGTDDDIKKLSADCPNFLVTLGQIKDPKKRMELFMRIEEAGGFLPSIISSRAYVSPYCQIGEGSIIMHGAVLNAGAIIGVNCIINSMALVEHDAIIGNHSHISTGSRVNGECKIGDSCFLGSGSIVAHSISIASGSVVSAGSVVLRDLTQEGVYGGNPAVRLK